MLPSHASSLADGPARKRVLYPSPLITAPSVLVIDVPAAHRGRGLSLDRYYVIIIENDAERSELERFLTTPRSIMVPPDLLDHRPSNHWSGTVVISRYEPPAPDWPWLLVARWPDSFSQSAGDGGISMARGCYTMELFEDPEALQAHSTALLENLASHYPISVRLLSGDAIAVEGTA